MPDHLDFGWHDVQLLRGHLADLIERGAVVGANPFWCAQLINEIHPWQGLRQFLATSFLTGVCRNSNFFILRLCFSVRFGFIKKKILIRGYFFTAGGIAPGQCQVELFLEGQNLGFVTLILDRKSVV